MVDLPTVDRYDDSARAADYVRLALLPSAVALGSSALLWMAGFGASPPAILPIAALLFLGALFSDAVARSLRRCGPWQGMSALAGGLMGAILLTLLLTSVRDLWSLLGLLAPALLLVALPRAHAVMLGAMSVYVVATLLANYTLDAFLPVGDWFLVNVGTLFFGVTFTQRDRVHRYGRRAVYLMILSAATLNVVAAVTLSTPLRFVAVSFLAIVVSEAADTEVYQRLRARRWWVRVLSSNAVSAPVDTVLFTVLAFAGMPFATLAWMLQVITTDVVVKYGSGLVAALILLRGRKQIDPPATPGGGTSKLGSNGTGLADLVR